MFASSLEDANARAVPDKPNTVLLDATSLHEWSGVA